MNQVDQKWWDIIKPPGGSAPAQGVPTPSSPQSPLMNYAQGGGLDRWLGQPRTPGSGGTPQPPPVPQAPAPTAPPPRMGGGTDARSILEQGYGYHPLQGFMTLSPQEKQMYDLQMKAKTPRVPTNNADVMLWWLQQQGLSPAGDQAQGVGGVAGNGPDGTDGGL